MAAALLIAGGAAHARTEAVTVRAELDSTVMIQGYRTALRVTVLGPEDAHTVDWPRKDGQLAGIDVVDVSCDTTGLGNGRLEQVYTIMLQPFDPDTITIPPLRVASGTDTAATRSLVLKVLPVELDSLTEIHPMEGPAVYTARWFDWIPSWATDYWGWILLALGLAAAGVAAWMYFRKGGTAIVRKRRELPPYELALRRLGALRERRLAESGHEKEYYTELTDILRQYLEGRFGINAMVMTSAEIMRTLRSNDDTRMSADNMRAVLEVADFVKFAKMRPLPDDNVKTYQAAVAFVEATKPAPEPEAEDGGDVSKNKSNKN
ncbi:MAG: BatD family protein [Muribaculaceae bacterium]|nr:BatD family protein [Muribaculaceae bacterium]